MKIFHNPRCSKSRETLKLLQEKGIEVEVIKYLEEKPSFEDLEELIQMLGIKPEELIRKGEADFKENFKDKNLPDKEWIQAMVDFPRLIERPIVIDGNKAIIGRPPIKVLDLF